MSVLRQIARMAKELAVGDRAVDAFQLKAIYAAAPGLYEWLFDQAPPASGSQEVRGHDHSGSSNHGGLPIPMNAILSVGYGAGSNYMYSLDVVDVDGWLAFDNDCSPQQSVDLGYMWNPYVTDGLGSTNVEGFAFISCDGDVDLRIYNRSNTSTSDTASHTVNGQIRAVHIRNIPVDGGQQNELTLQAQTASESSVNAKLWGLIIAEIYRGGHASSSKLGSPLSQPASTGEIA
tara:strand:+ start:229 stop:927 length:699 start_codon:yes stop_codon:yes gene_type:complete